jgi:hypothetical protein
VPIAVFIFKHATEKVPGRAQRLIHLFTAKAGRRPALLYQSLTSSGRAPVSLLRNAVSTFFAPGGSRFDDFSHDPPRCLFPADVFKRRGAAIFLGVRQNSCKFSALALVFLNPRFQDNVAWNLSDAF